ALAHREGGYSPQRAAKLLRSTRPTAVDLAVGVQAVRTAWVAGEDPRAAADRYRAQIVEECHRIGIAGAPLLRRAHRVLTHCNAGALATVEWGTALAPIRVAHDRGVRLFVWVDETRPLLQGSRLTAWELTQENDVPFYVAAPWSTFDASRTDGTTIPVEERDESEVLEIGDLRIAPKKS